MSAWQWWFDKLAGKPMIATPNNPQAGFYRKRIKERYGARSTFLPVAYWPDAHGQLHCREGDRDVDDERALTLWQFVNNRPVTEEAYREVADRDGLWPDEHPLVPMQGHNMPPEEDTFEEVDDAIRNLVRDAEKRLEGPPIADQNEADQIANLADRLTELCNTAKALRDMERKPHDDEVERIVKKWKPLITLGEIYKGLKLRLLTPWQQAEKKRLKEEAEAAEAAGEPPAADDSARRPRAGTRGRAMTLKQTKRANIIDYRACLEFFLPDNEEIRSCVQKLANQAVRAGATNIPGVEIVIEEQTV